MGAKKKSMTRSAAAADEVGNVGSVTNSRRHRPSSKAKAVVTPSERRAKSADAKAKARTGRGSKKGLDKKPSARREDKREDPREMESNARQKNLKADKNNVKSKGKSTRELEASNPEKRPSRKSKRGGANRIKPDSQLRRRATREVRSAKNRATMQGA